MSNLTSPTPQHKKIVLRFLASFVLAILAAWLSYRYIDHPLAHFITALHGGICNPSDHEYFYSVSLTVIFYLFIFLIMCIYASIRFFDIRFPYLSLAGMLSLGVSIGFFVKEQMQVIFGRLPPCVAYNNDNQFFHLGKQYYSSFPSGHMIVFTCFLMIFTFYYPKLRALAYLALFCLACALMLRGYHYLSDIIVGTYIGATIALAMKHVFKIEPFNPDIS